MQGGIRGDVERRGVVGAVLRNVGDRLRGSVEIKMCGICGVVRFDDDPVDRFRLEQACATLRHRGPDHQGAWLDARSRAGLGGCRLAVIDPSPACHQPLHSPDGRFHLVFNGAIYNFRELRRELEGGGASFVTQGDTEVVLIACARWGVDALPRFSGMFAFAYFDSQTRTGLFARDRYGIKPLLYKVDSKRLVFGSELPAVRVLAETSSRLNESAVTELLTFGYIAHPATILADVHRLAPGQVITFSPGGADAPRFYDPPPHSENVTPGGPTAATTNERPAPSYGSACSRVRAALADAVLRHRAADVPLGAFLSGGMDSSIVVAHLAEASGEPVPTFCVGYEDAGAADERRFACCVAERFATEHHEVVLTRDEVVGSIPEILDHLDEPFGDSSIIPTALLSRFARRRVVVALSGDGGDELFGGYWRYLGHASLASYRRIPVPVRRVVLEPMLRAVTVGRAGGLGNRARQFQKLLRSTETDALARHLAWSRILSDDAMSIFGDPDRPRRFLQERLELAHALTRSETNGGSSTPGVGRGQTRSPSTTDDELDRVLRFDLRVPLPGDMLRKVDVGSMMHSLEVRVPFLDPAIVELASGLPTKLKIRRGIRKRILIDAYRGFLPDEVLDREKRGFEVPFGEYLRGPLRDLFWDTVTPASLAAAGNLSFPNVQRVFAAHLDRRADHSDLLFALLSLGRWIGNGGLKTPRTGL